MRCHKMRRQFYWEVTNASSGETFLYAKVVWIAVSIVLWSSKGVILVVVICPILIRTFLPEAHSHTMGRRLSVLVK